MVAWLVALLLIGEGLRNTGRFTMGDVMAYRLSQRPPAPRRRCPAW
jgi:cation/acetate symporter